MREYFLFTLLLVSVVFCTAKKPNIIFVLVDDVGWADFSYNIPEGAVIPTKNIDEISAQGIRLKQHYVHPTCTPTRASLMTGKYAMNTGLSMAMLPGCLVGLPPEMPTLPQMLRTRGSYSAHMVGKWHLGHAQWRQTPVGRGFESHTGCFMWDIDSYTKQMYQAPWQPMAVDWIEAYENKTYRHFAEGRHATVAITSEAEKVMQRHALANTQKREQDSKAEETPLFLYVAYTAAHSPLQPLPHHDAQCQHIAHEWRRLFCGMVLGLDEGIKNITNAAKEHLGDNTIIVVSSDNGGSTWFGGLNTPFRSGKTTPFEGGVRVPAFAVDLSKDGQYFGKGGREYKGMMHISDWFPTLLSVAGININDLSLDGVDLTQALKTGGESPRTEMLLDMYYGSNDESIFPDDLASVRKGKYKLIEGVVRDPHWYYESSEDRLNTTDDTWVASWGEKIIRTLESLSTPGAFDSSRVGLTHATLHSVYTKRQGSGSVMLFDIENDPEERNNLASSLPEVVSALREDARRFRDARVPQGKYWMTVDKIRNPLSAWERTFTTGDCSMNNIPDGYCRFTHPWLADDADLSKVELIHGGQMYRMLFKGLIIQNIPYVLLAVFIALVVKKAFFS